MPALPYELRVIFLEEFRRQIRNKGFIFFTAVIIVVMAAAIPIAPIVVDLFEDATEGGAAGDDGAGAALRYGYADPDGVLPAAAQQDDSPMRYDSKAEGIEAVRKGEIDTLFVLPADYIQTGRIEDYWSARDRGPLWDSNWDEKGDFRQFLRESLTAGREFPDEVERAFNTGYFVQFDVVDETNSVEESGGNVAQDVVELLALLLFAVLLVVAVMTGAGSIIRSVSEEKETRMIELLITSASPFAILSGKLLAVVLVGLVHISVWITVGAFATPAVFDRIPGAGELAISGGSLVVVSFCFVLGYILFSALSMFLGTIANSVSEGQRQMGLLSVLVGLPIWMAGLVINVPDLFILKVMTYVPFFAPTMLMVRLGAGSDVSNLEIGASLAIVAVTALAMTWIASRVFSVGILLSGQTVTSPRSLLAALRQSD